MNWTWSQVEATRQRTHWGSTKVRLPRWCQQVSRVGNGGLAHLEWQMEATHLRSPPCLGKTLLMGDPITMFDSINILNLWPWHHQQSGQLFYDFMILARNAGSSPSCTAPVIFPSYSLENKIANRPLTIWWSPILLSVHPYSIPLIQVWTPMPLPLSLPKAGIINWSWLFLLMS